MLNDFFTQIDAQAFNWLFSVTITLLGWLGSGPLRAIVTLTILVYGFALIRGHTQTPLLEGMGKFLVLTLVLGLAAYPGALIGYIYPFFFEAPFKLAALLPAAPGSTISTDPHSVYSALDTILSDGFTAATEIAGGPGWFAPTFFGLAVILITCFFVIYAAFLLILAKLALALLLGFTPLFLVLMLFQTTRGLFERWLGMLFNYSLIPLLTLAICGFSVSWVNHQLNTLVTKGVTAGAADVAAYVLAGSIAFLLLLQVTTIAASIGGGLGLSSVGFMSAAYGMGRSAVINARAAHLQRRDVRRTQSRNADRTNWQKSISQTLNRVTTPRRTK